MVPTAKIPFGSSVAVLGFGGVGLNAVQGAFASSAYPIIAVDLLDWKLEETKQFGATHGVRADSESAEEAVREITVGRGVDYAFITGRGWSQVGRRQRAHDLVRRKPRL